LLFIVKKEGKKIKHKKIKNKGISFKKEIKRFEKDLGKEIKDVEKWMHERKKFFIKLAWVVGFIIALLIFSHFYLRVYGVGI